VLTEQVQVGDVPLVLMDTAGLRETDDPVERMGLARTHAAAREAELVLYVVDGGETALPDMRGLDGGCVILVVNKCDRPLSARWDSFGPESGIPTVRISARTGQGLDKLYNRIEERFLSGISTALESDIITRERHKALLREAMGQLGEAVAALAAGEPEDLAAIPLRGAYLSLGHILGLEYGDDIIDRIFAEFCVGK
jgi:tRNA modification GTPase